MPANEVAQKYIALLKRSLVGELYIENEARILSVVSMLLNGQKFSYRDFYEIAPGNEVVQALKKAKLGGDTVHVSRRNWDGSMIHAPELRNFTELSHTLIGTKRLDNLQACIETVLDDKIEGDLIETGVWRGGAVIFMRGVLAAYDVKDRTVWAADSFQGLPPPTYPQDAGFDYSEKVYPFLSVSQQAVAELFERYGLLDEQVKFLAGWFKDTLASAPIKSLAVLRLDGDLYESTMDVLNPLYDKVSRGGFVIVDDYFAFPPCKRATDEFRASRSISDSLIQIDECGAFWRKC